MKIHQGSLLRWLAYPAIAFLLFVAGRAALFILVYHEDGLAFLVGMGGVPALFVSIGILFIVLPHLRNRHTVVLDLGDDVLDYLPKGAPWVSLPYRAMREAWIYHGEAIRTRGLYRLHITMEDGQTHTIELTNLDRSPDEIFAELKRRLPAMTQPDTEQSRLVLGR